jgi:hypothetical protein
MNVSIEQQLKRYLTRLSTRQELRQWIESSADAVLDHGDPRQIERMNETEILLMGIDEGQTTEAELRRRVKNLLGQEFSLS